MSPRRGSAAERVGDVRISQADAAGKPPSVINSFGNDDVALHNPKRTTRTQEQQARSDALDAAEERSAGGQVCDQAITGGCGGGETEDSPGCSSPDHGSHVEAICEVLEMLGLREGKAAPKGKRGGLRRFER